MKRDLTAGSGTGAMAAELRIVDDAKRKKKAKRKTKAEMLAKLRERRATWEAKLADASQRAVARVLSFGGGVQTTAQLLREPGAYSHCIFADPGAEDKSTYEHIRDRIVPYCEEHEIEFVRVTFEGRKLEAYCWDYTILPRASQRWCTEKFKIRPINRYLRETLGATAEHPAIIDLDFSYDEATRVAKDDFAQYAFLNYPLVDAKLTREDCRKIIKRHGWEIPAKSACDFCMFHGPAYFRQLSKDNPKRFREIMEMEENCAGFPGLSIVPGTTLRKLRDSSGAFANTMEQYCTSGTCFR